MYLMDSIVKNVGREYLTAFTKNLVATFICVFEKVYMHLETFEFKKMCSWLNKYLPLCWVFLGGEMFFSFEHLSSTLLMLVFYVRFLKQILGILWYLFKSRWICF